MVELLAMLGGGVARLIPYVVDFIKQRNDADHEFRMAQLQIDQVKAQVAQAAQMTQDQIRTLQAQTQAQIQTTQVQTNAALDTKEADAEVEAVKGQAIKTGYPLIDAISATVRPVLTYYWCVGLYGAAKLIQIIVAFDAHASLAEFVPILVTEFDRAVIGSMLSFWFLDRALRRK